MQKIIFCLQRQADQSDSQLTAVLETWLQRYQHIFWGSRYALADNDVAAAAPLRISMSKHPQDAIVSVWCDYGQQLQQAQAELDNLCAAVQRYDVLEAEPLKSPQPPGRVPGMCQVAFIKKPATLNRQDFLTIWLKSHTNIAIETQSTLTYRQNILVLAEAAGDWPLYDAIVEEHFPAQAMTDRMVFFAAEGNAERYRQNQQRMLESCSRFIDFSCFDCIPMSEYTVKRPAWA